MSKTLAAFRQFKQEQRPICMLTCYSFPTAQQIDAAGVDIALVGDSLGTTLLGYDTTTKVTMIDMQSHVGAVARGCDQALVLADMPFQSYDDPDTAVKNAQLLTAAGADAVKVEGPVVDVIRALSAAGISVCAHLGYLPQSADRPAVVGKEQESARQLLADAKAVEAAGADMLVLELMPKQLSAFISQQLVIPTIGIGAGVDCDGQVQVIDDLLGMGERVFRHAKAYAQHRNAIERN